MAELQLPSEDTCSARLSQEEIQMPLSPVLGTGHSLKKLLKNRKGRQKRDSNKVVQKLENILEPPNDPDKSSNSVKLENSASLLQDDEMLTDIKNLEKSTSNIEAVPGPSESKLSLDYNPQNMLEDLLNRIQKLEEVETRRVDIIKAISLSKSVNKVDFSPKSKDRIDQVCTDINSSTNKEELGQNSTNEKPTNRFQMDLNKIVHFQTGTGRDINISETDIKKSGKLFDDILLPTKDQSSRNKKFNYLSKNRSDDNCRNTKNELASLAQTFEYNKDVKNIIEGENFDDLNVLHYSGFKAASVLRPESDEKDVDGENSNGDVTFKKEKDKFEPQILGESLQKPIRNIFEGEDFNDLKPLHGSGFKTASVTVKDEQVNNKVVNSAFNICSTNLGNEMISEESKSSKILPKMPLINTVANIFKDQDFDDLKLPCNTGFQSAACLKDELVFTTSNIQKQEKSVHKTVKNIFEGENFDDLAASCHTDFQSASERLKDGKNLDRTELRSVKSLNSIKKALKNVFEGEDLSDLHCGDCVTFKPASVSLKEEIDSTKVIAKEPEEIKTNIFGSDDFYKEPSKPQGIKRALVLESNAHQPLAKKPFRNIFEGESFDDLNLNFVNFQGFKNSLGNCRSTSTSVAKFDKPKGFKNIFEGENFDDLNIGALGTKFENSLTSLKKDPLQCRSFKSPYRTPIKNVENNTSDKTDNNFHGFDKGEKETALNIAQSNCDIVNIIQDRFRTIISQGDLDKPLINLSVIEDLSKKLYSDKLKFSIECDLTNNSRRLGKKRKFSELDSDHNSLCQKENVQAGSSDTPLQKSFLKRPKKRLGCHFSPTIQISETVLKKAKLFFEDLERAPVHTSTPIKFDRSLAAPLVCDLTPVQGVRKSLAGSFLDAAARSDFSRSFRNVTFDQTLVKSNGKFGLNRPSDSDVRVWLENLRCERRILEERLRVVDEKQTILTNQATILQFSAKGKNRILPGVLYKSKSRRNRISLKELCLNRDQENSNTNFLNQVNPQNAHLVHFYVENTRLSHIQTQDGAVIIPSIEGRIGISEIEHSFKVLEAVDPSLIPNGWIHNHYKWIVWKLASYERSFPDKFEGCFSLENVVQQLKYRYDIEIDQVKRSALQKIFERDDCPQRRLVLCVSRIVKKEWYIISFFINIQQINNTYELELTDGWYPIRTVIDPLLCDQILKGKIKLGIKLMTCGAELINCEGCHPLEATDQICLKINYNSTRRAAWWTKLGCQRVSGPFLVPLSSIDMEGGKIGCIRCFISRVYPVKYLEKCGDTNVWRNRRAEERREQEFYNEKIKTLERTNSSIYSEHNTNGVQYKDSNRDILKCIRNVDDPETLYNTLLRSSDPESIQENLSTSQKTLLYNYTINKSAQDRSKLLAKINENAKVLQERSVTSLLKIKVVDASCESDAAYDFHLWRPQDSHLQELKEGEVVTVFNVSCSQKWGLSANRTTQFKKEQKPKDERFQKFRRKVTSVEELQSFSEERDVSDEFDTVGIVVKKKVGDHQQVWLTDLKENLLCIKIHEPSKNVLVLDTVNEGQIVTGCNLVLKHYSADYSFAVGDHFVVFSRYSQFKHLQEAADVLEKDLECVNLCTLLQSCRNKVDKIESKWNCKSPKLTWDMDMDCSQITTTDLALLECVDKLM